MKMINILTMFRALCGIELINASVPDWILITSMAKIGYIFSITMVKNGL